MDNITGNNISTGRSSHFDMNQHIQEFERHSRDETMFGKPTFQSPTRPSQLSPPTNSSPFIPSPESYKSRTVESKTVKKSESKKVMFAETEKEEKNHHESAPEIYHSTKSDSEDSSYGEVHHQYQPVTIISMSESEDESVLDQHHSTDIPSSVKTKTQTKTSTSKNHSNLYSEALKTNDKTQKEEPPSILDEAFVEVGGGKTDQSPSQSHLSNTRMYGRGKGTGIGRGRGRGEIHREKSMSVDHNEREKKVSAEEVKETSYSIIPESKDVLDSPASRHLITKFEKFLVQEIIGKSQRDDDIKTSPGTIPTRIPSAQSKSKSKISPDSNLDVDVDPNPNVTSILNPNNESTMSINKFRSPSTTGRVITSISSTGTKSSSPNVELIDPPKILAKGTVQCRFVHSGCKEILEKGSIYEQDHYQSCKFRPLQCILMPSCTEIIAYHQYIPHLNKHFLVPIYENEITSSVILTRSDFSKEQQYRPKWFSAYDFHFFTMIQRTAEGGGVWKAWVWMLGSKEEADEFAVRITFTKGIKNISEVFPVHSIRVLLEEIEKERTCLLVKDETMVELTNMKENVFTDFQLQVKLIPHAKNLNGTTRQLRSLDNQYSRRLISEKDYYVTTINGEEEEI